RHGTDRVAKAVLISAVAPSLVRSEANPDGLPAELFDGFLAAMAADRSQFYLDLARQFYGADRPGATVSQGLLDQLWEWAMQSGLKSSYECVEALAEADFSADLERFDVPTLLVHGEDDQVVPATNAARSARLLPDAEDVYYPAAPHGLTATHQDRLNADLLACRQGCSPRPRPRGARPGPAGAATAAPGERLRSAACTCPSPRRRRGPPAGCSAASSARRGGSRCRRAASSRWSPPSPPWRSPSAASARA